MRSFLVISVLIALAVPAVRAVGDERSEVKKLVEAREILPFETIRARVAASVRGEYVGAVFNEANRSYRFRFMNEGTLFNIDVDARTGERINRRQRF